MKFSGYVGYDTRNNLEHFGDDRFNPLSLGFLFYFLGLCLMATSRNTGWMDIHEIFRIWTQKAIGYTVWRLSRLFLALQTRRGGGLHSRSASCYVSNSNTWYPVMGSSLCTDSVKHNASVDEKSGCPIFKSVTWLNASVTSNHGPRTIFITRTISCP